MEDWFCRKTFRLQNTRTSVLSAIEMSVSCVMRDGGDEETYGSRGYMHRQRRLDVEVGMRARVCEAGKGEREVTQEFRSCMVRFQPAGMHIATGSEESEGCNGANRFDGSWVR